jgi:hypothetical protein
MRKFTFLFILALGALLLQGQTHKNLSYKFNNTLAESKGIGPTLTILDSMGVFETDTLNEVNGNTKTVYRFIRNSGLQFDNNLAGHFVDSTYTIELYFVFDELGSWKRVIDWKNRTSDHGAYVYNGEINFYPWVYSNSAPVVAGEYTYYVVTRNGLTNNLKVYTDALVEVEFIDDTYDGVIDTASNVLHFFQDDLYVQNEASSGAVALLNIYNYELDSATIKHKFDSLHGQLFAVRELNKNSSMRVYPNPASDGLNVDLRQLHANGPVNVSLVNSTGSVVFQRPFVAGTVSRIDLQSLTLPDGIYMVRVVDGNDIYSQKFVIRR